MRLVARPPSSIRPRHPHYRGTDARLSRQFTELRRNSAKASWTAADARSRTKLRRAGESVASSSTSATHHARGGRGRRRGRSLAVTSRARAASPPACRRIGVRNPRRRCCARCEEHNVRDRSRARPHPSKRHVGIVLAIRERLYASPRTALVPPRRVAAPRRCRAPCWPTAEPTADRNRGTNCPPPSPAPDDARRAATPQATPRPDTARLASPPTSPPSRPDIDRAERDVTRDPGQTWDQRGAIRLRRVRCS
mgnify:CR=1 FL=1